MVVFFACTLFWVMIFFWKNRTSDYYHLLKLQSLISKSLFRWNMFKYSFLMSTLSFSGIDWTNPAFTLEIKSLNLSGNIEDRIWWADCKHVWASWQTFSDKKAVCKIWFELWSFFHFIPNISNIDFVIPWKVITFPKFTLLQKTFLSI